MPYLKNLTTSSSVKKQEFLRHQLATDWIEADSFQLWLSSLQRINFSDEQSRSDALKKWQSFSIMAPFRENTRFNEHNIYIKVSSRLSEIFINLSKALCYRKDLIQQVSAQDFSMVHAEFLKVLLELKNELMSKGSFVDRQVFEQTYYWEQEGHK